MAQGAVGNARRVSAVRWGVAGNIVMAWIVTMPAAAAISAAFYGLASALMDMVTMRQERTLRCFNQCE
ncbi:phosphate/sulfate permease [Rhizobium leguminosarum]|uniref:Phosphate/sulfate permease n=1 Tax=Rhizobium leguminosarum TaxID=384 RepID=A0AAE2MN88_RHILE|nr:phosphate/sulfate permease [Rhizobium leguminosarum]MBB4434238.1 phosphate/sulfate permease [Rhizobium esperanzae]MBB4299786.1 phosphate/sulfate permease [Rhizobium leguminosarum]MBB4309825.1 phosphate/sulfate permease [Rhizobium leguminosarum]MBB4419435.1 phosphate/sulfate permease [Rhizobium leguminosarum]